MEWLDAIQTALGLDADSLGRALFTALCFLAIVILCKIFRIPNIMLYMILGIGVGIMVLSERIPAYVILIAIFLVGAIVFFDRRKQAAGDE